MKPGPYALRGLLAAATIVTLGVLLSTANTRAGSELDSNGRFRLTSIVGGRSLDGETTAFEGGEASTFMGGIDLDLREARMAGDEAVIEISVVMGGVRLRVPDGWVVIADVDPVLGGVKNRARWAGAEGEPRLVVRGTILMGGLDISN